jgi:hypothetical protein
MGNIRTLKSLALSLAIETRKNSFASNVSGLGSHGLLGSGNFFRLDTHGDPQFVQFKALASRLLTPLRRTLRCTTG